MTVSVGRHNLARMRWNLSLTQADVARLVGCSLATVKAVETGKLVLSEDLASRISQELGFFDKDWLLKNDLDSPIPPILRTRSLEESVQAVVVSELFSRLFAVVSRMDKERARLMIELHLSEQLDTLRKGKEANPDAVPDTIADPNAIRFFIQNPKLLDPDLLEWVNLEGLLKSNQCLSAGKYETTEGPRSPEEILEWRNGKSQGI
jgi:DNA-binding XRE family transcriptional regulator